MKTSVKILQWILSVIGVLLVVVLAYVAYVFIDYHRIEDNQTLDVANRTQEAPKQGVEYSIVSYNMGFGAYEPDFGFFMDGGGQSRAWSSARLDRNLGNIGSLLKTLDSDFYLIQEVDINSTRSYHFDQRRYLTEALDRYSSVFALNYDSPYLFYPFTNPHGKSVSGIMTFSAFDIQSALRRSLPVETGFSKLLDLDRCYTKSRIAMDGGGTLVLYNFHLSAYTSDGVVTVKQLELLLSDMYNEYTNGAWCIAGGDFNKDIAGVGSRPFCNSTQEYTWAQPVSDSLFTESGIIKVSPYDSDNPVASCRNADGPYHPDQYQIIIDGFLVSPNVTVRAAHVIDTQFACSDHNPVQMSFMLQ